ncbi:MAG: integrase [Lachnospiraceae bacterium]|nr:integrase [Lachnospiraceae bacterium]
MKKRSKLPNGFGCIKKLSGNRKRPYAAYPTSQTGGVASQLCPMRAIGYYEDWYSAYNAIVDFRRSLQPGSISAATFTDIYHAFFNAKFVESRKQLSDRSRMDYASAYKNVPSLHQMSFCAIRKHHMQKALDECTLGYSSLSNIKKLYSQMYKYAMENDIIEKNYAQFVAISQENDIEKGEPFTQEDIDKLWQHKKDPAARIVLMMIYSGFRISAYETIEVNVEEQYFKGGVKTRAGKNRIVPFHRSIIPFAKSFRPKKFNGDAFRRHEFYPLLNRLDMLYSSTGKKHTPHDCRHTFSWLCDKYSVDDLSKHMLMGHSLGSDVEKSVYGHRTVEQLRMEINKIDSEAFLNSQVNAARTMKKLNL